MTPTTIYKNDIDTVTPAGVVSDLACWVCDKPIGEGEPVGRDHRALCHPDRQYGAGDFGHAACIDDAISSGIGGDYKPDSFTPGPTGDMTDEEQAEMDAILEQANQQTLTGEELDALSQEILCEVPDRVGNAVTEAMCSMAVVEAGDSTPHERSTARRWVNFMKNISDKMVDGSGITQGKIDRLYEALSDKLDAHVQGKSPYNPVGPGGEGRGQGVPDKSDSSQNGESQDGDGATDADGEEGDEGAADSEGEGEAKDEADDGTDESESEGDAEGEQSQDDSQDGQGDDGDVDVKYVTHPEMDTAIGEAKQDMDTRLMGVGVRLAEQFATLRGDVSKVNKAIDDFGRVDANTHEIEEKIKALHAEIGEAMEQAKRQVRVIEIKQAGKVTKLEGEHYHPAFAEAMKYIGRGRDIFFAGPTGCGKTHLAAQIARALGREFSSCSLSEGIDESNFWGRAELNQHGGMEFYDGDFTIRFETGGVYLGDEADGSDPNVLLTFNSAISNGFCNVPNRHRKPRADRHEDFVFILGANTIGKGADRRYVGRNQLDLSTLKRFEIVEMDYDKALENKLVAEILEGAEAAEFCGWAHGIREKIEDNRLEQVFGTREMIWRAEDRQLGDTYEELEAQVFKGWRDDEIAKVKGGNVAVSRYGQYG